MASKTGRVIALRKSPRGACLLLGWCPAVRRRESEPGFCAERGNLAVDAKGEARAGGPCKRQSTDAVARGGAARSSEEAYESGWSEGVASSGYVRRPTSDGRSL